MTWLLLIPALVLLMAIYIFFAPIYIEINSRTGLYCIRLHRLASVRLVLEEAAALEVKVGWWKKKIPLRGNGMDQPVPVKKTAKKKRKPGAFPLEKILQVLRSFKVKTCHISIDTGSMPANGILYPLFYLLAVYTKKDIGINFNGNNEVVLVIRNSLARMARAYMRKH